MSTKNKNMIPVEKARRLNEGHVYLMNEFEECVMKHLPGESPKWFCKFKGEKEYTLNHSTNLVTETYLEWNEITKEEYNAF